MTPQRFASGRFGGVARLPGHQVGRVISNLFGGGSAQELLDSAPFCSELLYTAIPQRAASGTTATFTRATTATVRDNEGVLRTAIAGEARFEGARRVRNLVPVSENFNDASVTRVNCTASGKVVTATSSGAYIYQSQSAVVSGRTYTAKCKVSLASGTKATSFWINGTPASPNPKEQLFTLTTTPQTVQFTFTAAASAAINLGIGGYTGTLDAGMVMTIDEWQLEDVTGQSVQTAGEYVSVGVASSPYYHGSMVDGVKCFATDINGAAIPSTTLLGYQAEGARTNFIPESQTFSSSTWTKTDTNVSADAAIAPDGTTTADKLTEASTTNGQHFIAQSVDVADGLVTYSVYAKAAERNWIAIYSGVATHLAFFNLSSGVVGTIGAGLTAAKIEPAANGFYRCSITSNQTGAGAITRGIYLCDADNSTSYTGVVGNGVYLWGAQLELGSFASSYIATTTVAVTRDPDILDYSSGDIPNIVWLAAGVKRESGVSGVGVIAELHDGTQNEDLYAYFTSATNIGFIGRDGGSTVLQSASVLSATNTYTPGTRAMVSLATSALAAEKKASDQGSPVTLGVASAGKGTVTKLRVGAYSTGAFQLQGNVGPLYGWTRVPSQSELNAVTA